MVNFKIEDKHSNARVATNYRYKQFTTNYKRGSHEWKLNCLQRSIIKICFQVSFQSALGISPFFLFFFLFYFIYASLHIHIVQKYGIIHSLRLSVSNLKFIESFMLIRIFSRMFPFPVFLSKIVIKRNNQKKEHSRDDSYYHERWTVERFDVWRQYCSHSWLRLP